MKLSYENGNNKLHAASADPSGIYKLKCNTCSRGYVGQSGTAIKVRYKEYIRYIKVKQFNICICQTHLRK
jgi:hypothetical protein